MHTKFDWDGPKAEANVEKHGVTFQEAQTIFGDPRAVTIFDEGHSDREDRFISIGSSFFGSLLTVVHTEYVDDEGAEVWWIISARRATRREAKEYAKQTKDHD